MTLKHLLTALALAATLPLAAQTPPAPELAEGEVRKVDKDRGRLTLKHGEIKHLEMPPMTMVFQVRDKAVLDTLKPGDKVRFRVVDEAGKYTVTEIQPAP